MFFFFKQKTAYEMRISDWSSDVCSSDLNGRANRSIYMPDIVRVLLLALFPAAGNFAGGMLAEAIRTSRRSLSIALHLAAGIVFGVIAVELDRKSVVSGKSVSVRVDLGGLLIIKKKTQMTNE